MKLLLENWRGYLKENEMDTSSRIMKAAKFLYEDDPDWFQGGCADVSMVIEMAAKQAGLDRVRVVSGMAQSAPDRQMVRHAWLEVGDRRVDPTWETIFGKQGISYEEESGSFNCFGVEEEDLDWKVEVIVPILSGGEQ